MRALSFSLIAGSLVAGLAASALLSGATPAAAATEIKTPAAKVSPTTEDIRCLLTMVAISQDKQRQQAAQIGVYYFLGRLGAHAPATADLTALIKAEEPKLTPKDLQAEAQRCGPMVQAGMNTLRTTFAPPPGAVPPAGAAPAAPPPAAPK